MSNNPCCAGGVSRAPSDGGQTPQERQIAVPMGDRSTRGQIRVPGGHFTMGDHFDEGYAADGEGPVHQVEVRSFHADATTVTNAAFAAFVKDSGYVTEAEEAGSSAVFHLAYTGSKSDVVGRVLGTPWWLEVRGASWRAPSGPGSDISKLQNHPVVHVSWHDAAAYARWAGKRLPTEAEWEYMARGGLAGARFAWGDELLPRGRWMANIWQGTFPDHNTRDDGYLTTAPVKSFRANGFGLWQTAGNVWEWCADWFSPTYYDHSPESDPQGPAAGELRVMRGGSYLCHDSYCHRYRVAARSATAPDSSSGNLGFRCVTDAEQPSSL